LYTVIFGIGAAVTKLKLKIATNRNCRIMIP
jgi:hypothetical protein